MTTLSLQSDLFSHEVRYRFATWMKLLKGGHVSSHYCQKFSEQFSSKSDGDSAENLTHLQNKNIYKNLCYRVICTDQGFDEQGKEKCLIT